MGLFIIFTPIGKKLEASLVVLGFKEMPTMNKAKQLNVVGAGVAGLCVAREMSLRGFHVRIIDRGGAEPGPMACSWWAGGMLAPFCEAESAEDAVLKMGLSSAAWWQMQTGMVEQKGSLVLALNRDQTDLRRFARLTQAHQALNAEAIAELEPDLSDRFQRALFYPKEAHLAPRKALAELRKRLLEDGVEFQKNDVDPDELAQQSLTIDCRGIGAKCDFDGLRGVKGEMLILSCPDLQLTRPIRLLHPRIPLYVVPRGGGIYMLGATMVESSAKQFVTARAMLELLNSAYALHPAFGEAEILEIGVDSRPAFNDNLPRIRREGQLIRANGLYRHGFLLAPSLARMVAEHVCDHTMPAWMAGQ